jgi:peptidoglycan/xylan/chitin deacetylase (PgdA/CDA1 family)
MTPEAVVTTGVLGLVGTALVGGTWGVLHPRATLFGPVVWRGPGDRAAVALTFDDGPHPEYTARIAEILSKNRAPATFFCIGQRIERHPGLATALHRAGHGLENHTFSHGTGRDLFQTGRLRTDLQLCQDAIVSITSKAPRYYRPAVGIRNPVVHRAARAVGLEVVTWTHTARDGAFALDARRAQRMGTRAMPGSILALHDGSSAERSALREQTVRNLPELFRRLNDRGLRLVTLGELLNPA